MKILSISGTKPCSFKSDSRVFALYTTNIQDEYICLASYRNYWDARKKFLEIKTNCPCCLLYFVECSEEEYFSSINKIKKNKVKGFIHNLFKF